MITEAPAKARSDMEILVEKLNDWIEGRIHDLWYTAGTPSFSVAHRMAARARIDELEWAKKDIKRLAEEITKAEER